MKKKKKKSKNGFAKVQVVLVLMFCTEICTVLNELLRNGMDWKRVGIVFNNRNVLFFDIEYGKRGIVLFFYN